MSGLAAVLSIKLMEVLYVPRAWHWFSILCSQADASRSAYLGYPEGTFLAEGKLVHALLIKDPPKHQFIHLELSATHKPLMVDLEHLLVACIFSSRLPPDEDTTPMDTNNTPQVDIQGPITPHALDN
jgi:hypothetical protein